MNKSLGKMLVNAGVLNQAQLEEAIQNQVIFGGKLGTNLLELGYINAALLSKALSKKFGCPTINPFKLKPAGPELLDLVGKKNVAKHEVVPLAINGNTLELLFSNPSNVATLDELQFITGKRIKIFVAPEIVVLTLIEKYYGIQREFRYKKLASKVLRKKMFNAPPKKKEEAAQQKKRAHSNIKGLDFEFSEDLSSQEDFERLLYEYNRQREEAEGDEQAQAAVPPPPRAAAPQPQAPPPPETQAQPQTPVPQQIQPPATPQPPPPPPQDERTKVEPPPEPEEEEILDLDDVVQEPVVSLDEPVPAVTDAAAEVEEEEEEAIEELPEALTLQQAMRRLNEVEDRDELGRVVLAFALSYFKRAALFITRSGVAMGWDGMGGTFNKRNTQGIMLPLNTESIFKTVHDSCSFFLGAIPSNPINDRFLKLTGDEKPSSAFLIPVLFGGKVVNILYGDNGDKSNAPTDISDLLILAPRIPQAFEMIIKKKKQTQRADT